MWIPRQTYEQQLTRIAALDAENRAVTSENANLRAYLDSLRMQLNRVEQERAQLLYNYTGVKVATPQIERAPESAVAEALQAVQGFQDVGDEQARRLGIRWDDDGSLKQTKD